MMRVEVSDPQFESENLRLITVNSPALGRRGDITLFLPPDIAALGCIPLLLLLHGVDCSHWAWTCKAELIAPRYSLCRKASCGLSRLPCRPTDFGVREAVTLFRAQRITKHGL